MDDLNDVFDSIALAENKTFEEAYERGLSQSRRQGFEEGFQLGLGKGLQIGTTVGFYRKFAEIHLDLLAAIDSPERIDSTIDEEIESFPAPRRLKLSQSLGQLIQLIDDFDINDSSNPIIFEQLEKIEAKYKKVKALLTFKAAKNIPSKTANLTF